MYACTLSDAGWYVGRFQPGMVAIVYSRYRGRTGVAYGSAAAAAAATAAASAAAVRWLYTQPAASSSALAALATAPCASKQSAPSERTHGQRDGGVAGCGGAHR